MRTDLKKGGSGTVVLIQPAATFYGGRTSDARIVFADKNFTSGTPIIHVGNLVYNSNAIVSFKKCGCQWNVVRVLGEGRLLKCSDCGGSFYFKGSGEDLSHCLFYLAMKQMVPSLPIGNFINCLDIPGKLGVISLAKSVLRGEGVLNTDFWRSD